MNQPAQEASTSINSRQSKRALNAIVEYLSQLLVASLLTMWGVFNGMLNARAYFGQPADAETMPWWITAIFVAITSLLPFAIGLYLFRRLHQTVNAGPQKIKR